MLTKNFVVYLSHRLIATNIVQSFLKAQINSTPSIFMDINDIDTKVNDATDVLFRSIYQINFLKRRINRCSLYY